MKLWEKKEEEQQYLSSFSGSVACKFWGPQCNDYKFKTLIWELHKASETMKD